MFGEGTLVVLISACFSSGLYLAHVGGKGGERYDSYPLGILGGLVAGLRRWVGRGHREHNAPIDLTVTSAKACYCSVLKVTTQISFPFPYLLFLLFFLAFLQLMIFMLCMCVCV